MSVFNISTFCAVKRFMRQRHHHHSTELSNSRTERVRHFQRHLTEKFSISLLNVQRIECESHLNRMGFYFCLCSCSILTAIVLWFPSCVYILRQQHDFLCYIRFAFSHATNYRCALSYIFFFSAKKQINKWISHAENN